MPDQDLLHDHRRQDMWSDLFNPFFAQCEDIWDKFEDDPQLLEAYELCHRMADSWTPDTIDHAAKYLERRRSRALEHLKLSQKHNMSDRAPGHMPYSGMQQRKGSLDDMNGGRFCARQTRQMQHQYSAEDFLQKKRMRRHSLSPSLPAFIKKRKHFSDLSDQEPYEMPPAKVRVDRRLVMPTKDGVSCSNRMVLEIRGGKHQNNMRSAYDKGIPKQAPRIQPDEMEFESTSDTNIAPTPTRLEDASCPETVSIIAESVQEPKFSEGTTADPTVNPPTQRYSEGLLNGASCSPRVWRILHGKGDKENDADNEAEAEEEV